MPITYWHYPNCSTCRRARTWLDGKGTDYTDIDLVAHPPTIEQLKDLHQRSGLPLKRFFNTSGKSYQGGGFKDKLPQMTEQEQYEALAADGKLIKRPILDAKGKVLVGFREAEYEALLGA
jgi:arsenate reductase